MPDRGTFICSLMGALRHPTPLSPSPSRPPPPPNDDDDLQPPAQGRSVKPATPSRGNRCCIEPRRGVTRSILSLSDEIRHSFINRHPTFTP